MISLTSPVETVAHRWPAGLKLGLLCLATVVLFYVESLFWQAALLAGTLLLYALPGMRFFKVGVARLKPLWPFVLLIVIWHFAVDAVYEGAVISLRMITAVALASLVTMTTRLTDMMALIDRMCRPLEFFGVRTERIALAMALVIRFIPVLTEKGRQLAMSWRARSRRRVGWRIVLPFALIAIDDAEHVADALKARGGL